MDCCIKTALTFSNITIASAHSLRSLGQLYGRISLRSKAAPINLPSMRGVMFNSKSKRAAQAQKRCFVSFLIRGSRAAVVWLLPHQHIHRLDACNCEFFNNKTVVSMFASSSCFVSANKQKFSSRKFSSCSFFQELPSTVFICLFSGARAFAVWSSPGQFSCCFS